MWRLTLIAWTFFASMAAGSPPASLELKGITPGMTREQINSLYPGQCPFLGADDWARGCRNSPEVGLTTIADQPVRSIDFKFIEGGKLGGIFILIDSKSFAAIAEGLTAKYGKPVSLRKLPLTNRMGAKFQQEIAIWKRGGQKLVVTKYAGDADNGVVFFASDEYAKQMEKGEAEKAKSRQRDL